MNDYAALRRRPDKHLVRMGLVVLLHILLVYALVSGLARKTVEVVKPPLETKIIQEVKPPPPEVPPPPPKLALPPPAFIPPPEVNIQQPPPPSTIAAVATTLKPMPRVTAPTAAATGATVNIGRDCPTPWYPAASARAEEAGTVSLLFFIDADGRVLQSKVESSSGYPRLDQAALEALTHCKFKPAVANGRPQQSWARLQYVWKLEE